MKKTYSKSWLEAYSHPGLPQLNRPANPHTIEIQTNGIYWCCNDTTCFQPDKGPGQNQLWARSNVLNAHIWLVEMQKMSLSATGPRCSSFLEYNLSSSSSKCKLVHQSWKQISTGIPFQWISCFYATFYAIKLHDLQSVKIQTWFFPTKLNTKSNYPLDNCS